MFSLIGTQTLPIVMARPHENQAVCKLVEKQKPDKN